MSQEGNKYKFFVGGVRFVVDKPSITGAEIKALAGIDPGFGLFQEIHEPDAEDKRIADSDSVNLADPGVEKFYTVSPGTYGIG